MYIELDEKGQVLYDLLAEIPPNLVSAEEFLCRERLRAYRPDICIGTDSFHMPKALADAFGEAFSDFGCSVEFNSPYAGTMVPSAYYHREPKVLSVMIEVNRGLYMNPDGGGKGAGFKIAKKIIITAIEMVLGKMSESNSTEFFKGAEHWREK